MSRLARVERRLGRLVYAQYADRHHRHERGQRPDAGYAQQRVSPVQIRRVPAQKQKRSLLIVGRGVINYTGCQITITRIYKNLDFVVLQVDFDYEKHNIISGRWTRVI